VEDIRRFVEAGVTTLDTADHYGASEAYIGRFLASCSEEERARVQVRRGRGAAAALPAAALAGRAEQQQQLLIEQLLIEQSACPPCPWGAAAQVLTKVCVFDQFTMNGIDKRYMEEVGACLLLLTPHGACLASARPAARSGSAAAAPAIAVRAGGGRVAAAAGPAVRRHGPALLEQLQVGPVPPGPAFARRPRCLSTPHHRGGLRCRARLQRPCYPPRSYPRYKDAGLYLMDLKAAGKIRHISVTNMDTQRLMELQDAGVEVATNQVGARGGGRGAGWRAAALLKKRSGAAGASCVLLPAQLGARMAWRPSSVGCRLSPAASCMPEPQPRCATGSSSALRQALRHAPPPPPPPPPLTATPATSTHPRRCSTRCWTGGQTTRWWPTAWTRGCSCCPTAWWRAGCCPTR
jgi:hypothetical protein